MARRQMMVMTALAISASVVPARAQVSEARLHELMQQAAIQIAAGQTATPAPRTAAQGDTRPVVRLSIEDAVKLALERNLDIAVQQLNPQINDISIASAYAVYKPVVTGLLNTQSTAQPPTSTLVGTSSPGAPVIAGVGTFNGGFTNALPWLGSSMSVQLQNSRNTTTSLNTLYNPRFSTTWLGQYTQPLGRNLFIDSNRRTIAVSKINRDISDVQLRATITNTLSNVRNAYWDYVFAVQNVEVNQKSVDLASQLVKDNQARVEVGTMAPIDVVQAQSQAATAVQNLAVARQTMATSELALKRLIVAGTSDPNWSVRLDPTDRPEFTPITVDVEAAIRRALNERTDLQIAKKDVEMNDVTLKFLLDQLKPQADFVGTFNLVGLGGNELIKDTSAVNSVTQTTIPGGYVDALNTMFGHGCPTSTSALTCFPAWTVALNISYPLGGSVQKANVARARVQLNQFQAQTKQLELQVATDVTSAAVTVATNQERVQAAQAARELAQKQLEAEQSKFEVGMSTNYNVIQSQRDLVTAQTNELQSILNYRKSLVELERLQQTTLTNLGITVLSAAGGGTTTTGGQ